MYYILHITRCITLIGTQKEGYGWMEISVGTSNMSFAGLKINETAIKIGWEVKKVELKTEKEWKMEIMVGRHPVLRPSSCNPVIYLFQHQAATAKQASKPIDGDDRGIR